MSTFANLEAGYSVGGRYRLTNPIAAGGMAQVWRAVDDVLDRPVALKILHPHLATDHGFLSRFRREAIAAARLSHPSIVSIYDTVLDGQIDAIVMELIEGETLRTVLDNTPELSSGDVVSIGSQVAGALAEAHRAGVVHRDIKPSNILLCRDRRVMVTDFGIAKAGEDTDLTVTGTLLGTAKYLSPEQVRGDAVDPRSDLYSLGVVLFEALAGQPPFKADTDAATALARLHNDPPELAELRPDAPPGLVKIIMRLLQPRESDRYARAMDVGVALSAIPTSEPGASRASASGAEREVSAQDATRALSGASEPGLQWDERTPTEGGREEPGWGEDLDEDYDPDDGFVRSERSWLIPALVLLLLGSALAIAGLLITRAGTGSAGSTPETTVPPAEDNVGTTPLSDFEEIQVVTPAVRGARAFDPLGDGDENTDRAGFAYDDDEGTAWRTETYRAADFGRLKPGVGLLLDMGGQAEISEVELITTSLGWSVEIYVGDDFSGEIASWGEPVASHRRDDSDIDQDDLADGDLDFDKDEVNLDFDAVEGTVVLVWITDHGLSLDRDDTPGPDHRFELLEVIVS